MGLKGERGAGEEVVTKEVGQLLVIRTKGVGTMLYKIFKDYISGLFLEKVSSQFSSYLFVHHGHMIVIRVKRKKMGESYRNNVRGEKGKINI